jgi:hypothetical protein
MNNCTSKLRIILLVFGILALTLSCVILNRPRILIIGDSISIGYTPFVKENLADQADVFHNPGNAQHSGTGLKKIEEWIGEGKWDIVQFNWGLWDLCYRHPDSKVQGNRDKANGDITFEVEDYVANLDSIVSILKTKTDAKLIFVTTTYVPENEAGRYEADAVKYNEAAKAVMNKHSIMINDIYHQSIPIHKKYGKGTDDVHYSEEGYEKLSELLTGFLKSELK